MSTFDPLLVSALVGLGIVLITFQLRSNKVNGLSLPPGPKRRFLIGNLLDVPSDFAWYKYHEWATELNSDIIYVNLAGQHVVVLDTYEATIELLEKRSSIYSSRPRLPMISELMGWEFGIGFMNYGEKWRRHRKIAQHAFRPIALKQYHPHQLKAAHGLLRRLAATSDPQESLREIQQYVGEIVISISYGIDVQPRDDPYLKLTQEGMKPFNVVAPGTYLVDAFPSLMHIPDWFPGADFKRKAKVWKSNVDKMLDVPFRDTKISISNGTAKPSLVREGFERMKETEDPAYTEDNIKRVAGVVYAAGSDSTFSTISWALIGLLMNPQYMKKAQNELDRVLKPGQLPDFNDEEFLPYIHAIVREAYRWNCVGPIAIPHYLEEEDVYNGYRIPAGTIVIPNSWAVLHDENRFPEPFKFNPDRFIKDGKFNTDTLDPADPTFGYGRRICPGKGLATASIWLALASVLSVFDITKPVDKDGNVIEPSDEPLPGLVLSPKHFNVCFKLRSRAAEELIRSTENEEFKFD